MYKKAQQLNPDFYGSFTDVVMSYEKLGEMQLHDAAIADQLATFVDGVRARYPPLRL